MMEQRPILYYICQRCGRDDEVHLRCVISSQGPNEPVFEAWVSEIIVQFQCKFCEEQWKETFFFPFVRGMKRNEKDE